MGRDGIEPPTPGGKAEYRCYEGMLHGFILMGGVLDTAREAVPDCALRLKQALA